MRRKLTITFLASLLVVGLWHMPTNVGAQTRLTLAAILTGLQTRGTDAKTNTLAKRNIYIAERVRQNGVTFKVTVEIEKELRNAGATTALVNVIKANGPVETVKRTPYAVFKDLWVDYGVTQGGQTGMRIHVKFTTYNMLRMPAYVAIYFQYSNGTPIKDRNGVLNSSSGDVALYEEISPSYENTDFNDLVMFMPYSELDLGNGNWDLQMDAKIIYKAGGLISQLKVHPFNYKKGPAVNNNTNDWSDVTFKFIRHWAEYDVTENGQRGMRYHVNFEVAGMKGVDGALRARVAKQDETFLTNDSADYSNDDGEFRALTPIAPGYDTTVYKDLSVFIPYNQFRIARGRWNLKLDIDIVDSNEDVIKHMTWFEFAFTKP